MMLDASKGEIHRQLLEKELESVGIRLNKPRPNMYYRPLKQGGLRFTTTVKQTKGITERLVSDILREHKIHNAEVVIRYDAEVDDFIDLVEGNRQYIPCLNVYNKVDTITLEEVDRLAKKENSVVISCNWDLNLDYLIEQIWEHLGLIRVYTKKRGCAPDFKDPVVLRSGATVEDICASVHKDMKKNFKYAYVWGKS